MMWGHDCPQSSLTGTKTRLPANDRCWRLAVERSLPGVPHQSADRLQVAATFSATWAGGTGGPIPPPAFFTAGRRRRLGGALACRAPQTQTLGAEKTARLVARPAPARPRAFGQHLDRKS